MGDHSPAKPQLAPQTPGRPSIKNPFESPNDYYHLREPLVPSPSVFRSKPCKTTPPKFNWSIDEMASLLPVHIDPEEIQRQSFYLSQTRRDSDIEEKCQNAIEQFFTKGAIVPSPWAAPESRRASHLNKKNPMSSAISEETEKHSVACQTVLSLPLAFDLEKLLGEYYRCEETCDAMQESLSSSSLRRKLFIDGQFNYSSSDSSNPPSPERANAGLKRQFPHREGAGTRAEHPEREAPPSVFASPLSCGISAQTPSTGQFSSSPIQQGCFRDCSLGSISSPLFPDRSSPAGHISPTISPIFAHVTLTPIGSDEWKQPCNLTPHGASLDIDVAPSNGSPFVEGCSPIRSCSPYRSHYQNEPQHVSRPKPRSRVCCWASPTPILPILNPLLPDNQDGEEHPPSTFSSCSHCSMELAPTSPLTQDTHLVSREVLSQDPIEAVKMEEGKEMGIEKRLEEEEGGGPSEQLTSSRMGNVSAIESSQMFVSLLAEGSSIRYDSSVQVDSGYNTTSAGTASLIDGLSSDCQAKEPLSSNVVEEVFPFTRHSKVKTFYPHYGVS
ncbi:protein aurora borealis [Kryptolebias marmoratus]|uniref:Protein aurora borealis n=1 Tax=Kryptolebias marmoratus TaxID=37003 RepID=A0A3Q2ZQS1_KRYMA|nr:protein aurora borealis [Kryptolebias marmoratus]